ncbi:hypothetical protein INT45_003385 [Circinella minor]|uniref:Uncharacterized protein n=1 Tax=Circinella minor TaxID=1195481 RepID=A0A8H7SB55_9FUNG|nr:hypothetical protein INT45_003385 [Circinella minor]
MRFSTCSVIFVALTILATVQALPTGTNDKNVLEEQDSTVTEKQNHTDKTENKLSGFNDLGDNLSNLAHGGGVNEVTSDVEEDEPETDDLDEFSDDVLLNCLEDDALEDCPDLDDFDHHDCLLLPDEDCLKKVRKFLKKYHEA